MDNSHRDVSLRDIILGIISWIRYLKAKRSILLIAAVIGMVFGVLLASTKKDLYVATASFALEDSGSSLGQYAGLASVVGISMGGGGETGIFHGDNLMQLYKSKMIIQRTLFSEVMIDNKRELLIDRYIAVKDIRKSWDKNPALKGLKFTSEKPVSRTADSVVKTIVDNIFNNNLKVYKPDDKLDLIRVEVRFEDEQFAKSFNDQLVSNVNDFYVQTKTKKALQNLFILQKQTDSVRSVFNGAIDKTVAISDATPNLNPTRQILRASGQKSQFNAEANKAILTQLVQNLEIAKITLRKETPLIQVIDAPSYPLDKERFGRLKGAMLGLLTGIVIAIFVLSFIRQYRKVMINT